jgi:hypothetical protein
MLWSRTAAETDETSEIASCRRSDSVLTSELAAPGHAVGSPLAAHGHPGEDTPGGSNPQLSEAATAAGRRRPRRDEKSLCRKS